MKKKILFWLLIFASGLTFWVNHSLAATEITQNITSETTWHESESPFIVKAPVQVLKPLTIEPGVIVKFKHDKSGGSDNGYLDVKNELKAVGAPDKKIIFTSIRDDEAGGDDNHDGSATMPARDDWYGINIYDNSYNSKLEYVTILYAEIGLKYQNYSSSNYRGLVFRNSEIKFCSEGLKVFSTVPIIENNKIEKNRTGIVAYSSPSKSRVPTFHNNSIAQNTITGLDGRDIYGSQSIKIDARHNWWGDASGPNPVGSGNKILGSGVMFDPWLSNTPQPMPKKPVILIPGIGASVNWDLMLGGVFPENWTLMSHTYDGILQALKSMGYEEDKNLFICYYDWRNNNSVSAENYLKPIIGEALSKSGAFSVNIVAHSMGGLVARSYIQSAGYRNDVENLIMIGTPNKGSSDVYPVWEGGYIPSNWENKTVFKAYLKFIDIKELTFNNYQSVHQFIPSVKELMPVYNYIHPKGNPNLLYYYGQMQERNDLLPGLNSQIVALNEKVKVISISGSGYPTVNKIPFMKVPEEAPLWLDGKPDPIDPERNDAAGDERVLLSSSQIQSFFSKVLNYDHGDIVSQSENTVADILGENLDKIYPAPEIRNEIDFWFASPVDVEITSPGTDKKTITKDANNIPLAKYSGESKPDGFKFVSIPNLEKGAYEIKLTGNGEENDDREYHAGSIFADYKNETVDQESEIEGVISQGQTKEYKIEYDPENTQDPVGDIEPKDTAPPILSNGLPAGELAGAVTETQISLTTDEKATCRYSTEPNIAYDSMTENFATSDGLSHTAIATGLEQWHTYNFYAKCEDEAGNINQSDYEIIFSVPDETPPAITGAAMTEPNANGWHNGDVNVHFTATDDESGIDTITPDITISTEGRDQSATGTATDKAGNSASFTVSGINIDKTPPVISGVPANPPNENNWYKEDVTVAFTCQDLSSGPVQSSFNIIISTEGRDQSAEGVCEDLAGNRASLVVSRINIDKTPPVIAVTSPQSQKQYPNDQAIPITYQVTDNISPAEKITKKIFLDAKEIARTSIDLSLEHLGSHALKITAQDEAGNSSQAETNFTSKTSLDAIQNNANHFWELGFIKKKFVRKYLAIRLGHLENLFDLLEKTNSNSKLKPKPKQVAVDALKRVINADIDRLIKQLNRKSPKWIDEKAASLFVESLNFIRP